MSAQERGCIRSFRPGRFGLSSEEAPETIRIRAANVEAYAKRVRAGLPIFAEDDPNVSPQPGCPGP